MAAREAPAQVGHLHAKQKGDRVHMCICCEYPIAVYGRVWPCLHAYCLSCTSDMKQCYLCQSDISRIERVPCENGLYISAATMQSFKSEEELAQHAQQVRSNISASPALAAATRVEEQSLWTEWRAERV
ncbi:hypothetical protein WJX72_003463 [[Myrmecia] bisecta]|uniref:RING-type domain-containing protein n=1 Tax=[Myrmecia] bisecta TaxID=41462 RepID=A0AAW1Q8I8_9CHLO